MPDTDPNTITPVPDPTVLTREALQRAITSLERELGIRQEVREREQEYIKRDIDAQFQTVNQGFETVRERFRGIEKATELLNETVNRTPTDIQKEIGRLRELMDERANSIALQFKERDTRQERESRDNKVAVDAAFAAQKEAASEQNKSNTLAIDKSERATIETIKTLAESNKATTDSLNSKNDDVKERILSIEAGLIARISNIEASLVGLAQNKQGGTEAKNAMYAAAGFLVSLIVIFGVLASAGAFK